MTASRRDDYIGHMAEAAELAIGYLAAGDEAAFVADRRTQQAVILNLIVIGEAATKLMQADPGFIAAHPEVPWKGMRGMRNRIAHGYFDIDLGVVWATVQTELPKLLQQLAVIRQSVPGKSDRSDGSIA